MKALGGNAEFYNLIKPVLLTSNYTKLIKISEVGKPDADGFDVNSGFVDFWAFEVAAVVKIKGLEDSSFRGNRFYSDKLVQPQ